MTEMKKIIEKVPEDIVLNDDTKIYRYMSLEEFLRLNQFNFLVFLSPYNWDDRYEGYFYSYLHSGEGIKMLYERIKDDKTNNGQSPTPKEIFHQLFASMRITLSSFIQCWTTKEESDTMWRAYSYNNRAIKVETTIGKLKNTFEVFIFDDISYLSEAKIRENKYYDCNTLFHKRKAFSHEEEIRFEISDNDIKNFETPKEIDEEVNNYDPTKDSDLKKLINIVQKYIEAIKKIKDITCVKVNVSEHDQKTQKIKEKYSKETLIDNIVIHPKAPDFYVKLIKDLWYNGQSVKPKKDIISKSTLYDPPNF